MRNAERSEARNGHPVSPYQAGLNSLHKRVQRPRRLRPCQTRIRGDLPYKIFFVHSVREFYQSEIADVNRQNFAWQNFAKTNLATDVWDML